MKTEGCVGTLGRVMRRFRSDSRLHTVAWAETGLGLDYRLQTNQENIVTGIISPQY